MKRFTFTLEKALAWRRLQSEQERAKLEKLSAERIKLEQRQESIRDDRSSAEKAIAHGLTLDAFHVATLPQWQKHTVASLQAIAAEQRQTEVRLQEQQIKLREAERQVKLLERLRERRLIAWETDLTREEESFAAEAFLAKCVRERIADLRRD